MFTASFLEHNLLMTYYRVQKYRLVFLTIGIIFTLLSFIIIFKSICVHHHNNFFEAAACPLKNGFGILALSLGCYSLWIACEMEVEKEAVRNTTDKARAKMREKGARQADLELLEALSSKTMHKIDLVSHTHGMKHKEKQRRKHELLQDFTDALQDLV